MVGAGDDGSPPAALSPSPCANSLGLKWQREAGSGWGQFG